MSLPLVTATCISCDQRAPLEVSVHHFRGMLAERCAGSPIHGIPRGIRRMVQVGEGVMATSGGPTVRDATIMLGGLRFHYRELTGRDPDSGLSALV